MLKRLLTTFSRIFSVP